MPLKSDHSDHDLFFVKVPKFKTRYKLLQWPEIIHGVCSSSRNTFVYGSCLWNFHQPISTREVEESVLSSRHVYEYRIFKKREQINDCNRLQATFSKIIFMGLFIIFVCYLHMQMKTLCRAVAISITTSYSTSVIFFYRGLTQVFITSPFCD